MTTIKRRITSGVLAGTGTIACMMVATYQSAHETDVKVDPVKAMKVSAVIGALAGIVWSLTPAAKETHEEVLEQTKEKTYPTLRMFIKQALSGGVANASTRSGYRSTGTSLVVVSDDGFDTDPVSDEEYALLLDEETISREERLSDPFYEGPESIFDM